MTRVGRRGFVRASAAAAAAAMARPALAAPAQDAPGSARVRRFKPLGKTGWKVGDISAGSGQRDPAVLNYIFESGINLIDTGFQYAGHEELVGKVLPKWRDKVFVLDKWDPPLITATVTKSALLEALDVSLQRLNTTYVDCMMLHSIGHPRYGGLERIQNPAIYEAWDEAKRLGKVRFTGASSHGVRMIEDMNWGLDNDRFDVILIGANFLTHGVEPLLKKARAKGVGTIAMKTMTTYKLDLNIPALQNEQTNARQACLKWILASDLFDTLVVSMPNYDRAAEYLAVSGTTSLTARDERYLDTVAAEVGPAVLPARAAGPATRRARTACPWRTSSATRCTSRTTARRSSRCSGTGWCRRRRGRRAAPAAPRPARRRARTACACASAWRRPTGSCGSHRTGFETCVWRRCPAAERVAKPRRVQMEERDETGTACVAAAIVARGLSAPAAAQPTAAEIVARSVAAHGGDALTSWQTLKITGTVVMQDGIAYTGAYTLLAKAPDRAARRARRHRGPRPRVLRLRPERRRRVEPAQPDPRRPRGGPHPALDGPVLRDRLLCQAGRHARADAARRSIAWPPQIGPARLAARGAAPGSPRKVWVVAATVGTERRELCQSTRRRARLLLEVAPQATPRLLGLQDRSTAW